MIDLDGSFSMSNTVKVTKEIQGFENLKIYPNPTNNKVNITMVLDHNEVIQIQIVDKTGKSVKQSRIEGSEGIVNKRIDLELLAAGVYTVILSNGVSTYSQKLILVK